MDTTRTSGLSLFAGGLVVVVVVVVVATRWSSRLAATEAHNWASHVTALQKTTVASWKWARVDDDDDKSAARRTRSRDGSVGSY
jgi:hypothetical protein